MIYLASSSPRRAALLTQLGVVFETLAPSVDEAVDAGEDPLHYVVRMARQKAVAGEQERLRQRLCAAPVLGADTIVVAGPEILHKPHDLVCARTQLRALSARDHVVHTALCLIGTSRHEAVSSTIVTFGSLTDADIDAYCATQEPLGKAGSYAIQGRGALFVTRIVGSYSGVVGLPLYECGQFLRAEGVL
ncbi:MAG: Maf family protein [Acidiferrobacter sp.]